MGAGSTSEAAIRDHARAESQLGRRDPAAGLQFASVRHAVEFRFSRGPSMQAALVHHPRGAVGPDGQVHVIAVDGGRGGSIDDVHATLQTIHDGLAALRELDARAHDLYVDHVVAGVSYIDLGKRVGLAPSTVGAHIGRAEWFLLGRFAGNVVIGRAR